MQTAFPALRKRAQARMQRLVALHVLFAALLCACADTSQRARSQHKEFTVLKADSAVPSLPDSAISGTEIELKGEEVCLRRKPRKDG